MRESLCRSCGAPIAWATTTNGKPMPLDPDPVPNGNVVIGIDGVAMVFARTGQVPKGFDRFRSHFATCPEAAKFRRGDR